MKLDEAKEILSKNGYNLLKESVEDDAEAVKKFIKYDDVTVYGDKIHNGIKSLIFVTDNEGHMFEDLEDAAESALIDASEAGLIDTDYSYDDDGEDETGLWVKYTVAD